tara:strand:+ start:2831 stop:3382 length:552 start_codon:yes stop_codon:yes gene_type:complete
MEEENTNEEVLDDVDTDSTEDKTAELEAELQKERGMRRRAETKVKKIQLASSEKEEAPEKVESKSSELDYDDVYLAAKGIEDDAEVDFVKSIKKKTGENIRTVLKDEFVQSRLEQMKADSTALKATPTGSKRGTPSAGKNSVDYWLAKGEFPPKGETKLRREYINRKMNDGDSGSIFTDKPVS